MSETTQAERELVALHEQLRVVDADRTFERRRANDAEAELSGLRADGTGTCYCDTVGETPCAYCRIKELEAEVAWLKEALRGKVAKWRREADALSEGGSRYRLQDCANEIAALAPQEEPTGEPECKECRGSGLVDGCKWHDDCVRACPSCTKGEG